MAPNGRQEKISAEELLKLAKYSENWVIFHYHRCSPYKDDMVSHALSHWYGRGLDQNIDTNQYNDRQVRSYVITTFRYRMRDFCFDCLGREEDPIHEVNPGLGAETGGDEIEIGIKGLFVENTPLSYLIQKEMIYALDDAVNKLPRAQRKAFIKRELEGLSNQEYAQSEGISEPAATGNYNRAIERLKQNKTLEEFTK